MSGSSRMYIKSMDAVWKHNYGYTGQYRDKIRDVIEDFKLDVEVKLLSSALLYHEDEDEVRTIGTSSQLCPRVEANMADLDKLPGRGCGMQGLARGGGGTCDLGLPQPLPRHRSPHEDDSTGGSEASLPH
uniref:Uncharacterized protein n=1 Tax=Guillardia theta TaxID=55529 RepID=A0A6U5XSB1_GUITH|mmetsp:Transcript_18832/g.61845  ORF Transcript_18832/g.61845 Transcript_18832/m.61845 type:complete len:130 (+) Transcript_18832:344-733(+)